MISRLAIAALALLLAQCALRPPGPEAYSFAVMGDTPYNDREEEAFLETLRRTDRERLAFVVHVGDMKAGGNSRCTDDLYRRRKAQFDASVHPLVFTPGDNDWTDCRRDSNGRDDPIERLGKMREIFFADDLSLGARRIPMHVQRACIEPGTPCRCGPFPENRAWEHGGVVFVTINVQGSNNNRGFDAANDREADCRDQANLAWLAAAEQRALSAKALVVLTQANLWDYEAPTYAIYVSRLVEIAARIRKPMVFVHGETHKYRVDTPFKDRNGATLSNPVRVEVYGSPFVGWVKVDVDTTRPDIFTFDPRLTALIPPPLPTPR